MRFSDGIPREAIQKGTLQLTEKLPEVFKKKKKKTGGIVEWHFVRIFQGSLEDFLEELPVEILRDISDEYKKILPKKIPDNLPWEFPDELWKDFVGKLPEEFLQDFPVELPRKKNFSRKKSVKIL